MQTITTEHYTPERAIEQAAKHLADLEDRQEAGEEVDEEEMAQALADWEEACGDYQDRF